jgi:CDP-glycerol glycerophosphotransferase (TagB/SpsB family)
MRVGFLFNHFAVHQVPHAAPYAFELSRRHPALDVVVICSTADQEDMARRIGALYQGHRCRFVALRRSWRDRIIDPIRSITKPRAKLRRKRKLLKDNLEFFRHLEAVVAPERNCLQLRTRFGLGAIKLIHTRHGAGDREGSFDEKSGAFDLALLPGQKYVDRLKELGVLQEGRYAVIGWPKFEVVRGLVPERRRFFANDRPVVVYNPHFDQKVSSWVPMGLRVLDFFRQRPEYNLIFAPHVALFKRRKRPEMRLLRSYHEAPNIHIDLGSPALADMTYILAADIYLGDVSSQIYEFLLQPRPCVFLNGHAVAWQDNPYYVHWKLGQVVDDIDTRLQPALDGAFDRQPRYRAAQQAAFAYTFRTDADTTAAQRGADAIARFLVEAHGGGTDWR